MVDYMPPGTNIVPSGAVEPGVFMLPTYTYGDSPFEVELEVHATPGTGEQVVTEFAMWMGDGKIVKGTFTKPPKDGIQVATVKYTFKYAQGDSQYTGRTFYPDVTIKTRAGAIKTMNHNQQKACEVWVKDPATSPK